MVIEFTWIDVTYEGDDQNTTLFAVVRDISLSRRLH